MRLLVSLLSFNVDIEISQFFMLTLMVAGLWLLFRRMHSERVGIIVLWAIIAHTAWHWMVARAGVFWQTDWPHLDAPSLTTSARWAAAILLLAGMATVAGRWIQRTWPGYEFGVLLRACGRSPSSPVSRTLYGGPEGPNSCSL